MEKLWHKYWVFTLPYMNKISKSGVNKIENCKPSFSLSFKVTSMGVCIIIILNVQVGFSGKQRSETETAVWQVYKDVLPWSMPIDRNEECRDGQRERRLQRNLNQCYSQGHGEIWDDPSEMSCITVWGLGISTLKWLEVCMNPVIFHEARLTSQGQFPRRFESLQLSADLAHSLRNWEEGEIRKF